VFLIVEAGGTYNYRWALKGFLVALTYFLVYFSNKIM
jgi:hypothetical protein